MPAGSSRHSSGRRTPSAAQSSSTVRWWSGCTPIWPSARLRSRTQSRRRHDDGFLPTKWTQPTRKKAVIVYGLFNFILCGSVAVSADRDAYSGGGEANAATVLVTATLDIAFTGGVAV